MAAKKSGKMIFGNTLRGEGGGLKFFDEITLSRTISRINVFLRFTHIHDGRQKMAEN